MSTSNQGREYVMAAALRAVWSRKLVAAATALAVCAAVVAVETYRGHERTSEAVVQMQGLSEAAAVESSGGWLPVILNELDSRSVYRQAADRAGWNGGQEAFTRSLDLKASDDGELLVRFSASEPEMAADGANAYAAAFVEEVERLGGERLAGGSLGAEAELEQAASPPEYPASRPFILGLVALVPGLLAGAGVALALAGRGRSWRDAEFALGAPVLGVIPELEPASRSGEGAVEREI